LVRPGMRLLDDCRGFHGLDLLYCRAIVAFVDVSNLPPVVLLTEMFKLSGVTCLEGHFEVAVFILAPCLDTLWL